MNLEATLRELADKEAIRDLARRYADCVWRKDIPGAVGLFAADGIMDMGDGKPIQGTAALLESYRNLITGPNMYPFVHNHVVELQGDRGTGTCYLDLRATLVDGTKMIGFGFYNDVYIRVGSHWKFHSRKLTLREYTPLPARAPSSGM